MASSGVNAPESAINVVDEEQHERACVAERAIVARRRTECVQFRLVAAQCFERVAVELQTACAIPAALLGIQQSTGRC